MEGHLIKQAIFISGKSQEEVAVALGISREHLNRLLKSTVPDKYLIPLKRAGIDVTDVIKSDLLAEPRADYPKPNILPLIPIEAMAGYGQGDYTLPLGTERYLIPEFNKKADFLIRISGTSMSPKYFNGDIVACKKIPTKTFLQWGKVYIMDTVQGVLCKRVMPSKKEGNIICHSDNSEMYPDFEISWKEVRSLAIVVGVIRLE